MSPEENFPGLSMLCQRQGTVTSCQRMNRRSSSVTRTAGATASAPIPLPTSHVRRTPSELQLEALTLLAERDDVRMYSRLLCGMYDQICHRYVASGGYVHPLSRESFRGVVRTKQTERDSEHRGQSRALISLSWLTLSQGPDPDDPFLFLNHDTEKEEGKQEEEEQYDEDLCMFIMDP